MAPPVLTARSDISGILSVTAERLPDFFRKNKRKLFLGLVLGMVLVVFAWLLLSKIEENGARSFTIRFFDITYSLPADPKNPMRPQAIQLAEKSQAQKAATIMAEELKENGVLTAEKTAFLNAEFNVRISSSELKIDDPAALKLDSETAEFVKNAQSGEVRISEPAEGVIRLTQVIRQN